MFDPQRDQPMTGLAFPPNTVSNAMAAWQQIEDQRQEDMCNAERLLAEEAAITGGLAMLGRWRQYRQPQPGTVLQYQRAAAAQQRNAALVWSASSPSWWP
jgi:hypothetical protein